MWVVQSNISTARETITADAPAALNYLLQSDHNVDQFIDSIRELQLAGTDDVSRASMELDVRNRFDVMWSSFYIFRMQFPMSTASDVLTDDFINNAEQFLKDAEPKMHPDHEYTSEDLSELVKRSRSVSNALKRLGHGYFINAAEQTDAVEEQISELSGYMRIFIALLMLTGGLGIGLLIRSNIRTNALFHEAQSARSELAYTVDELRSGRREQKAKDSFIASASHDLRQPLHALGLFLNSLKNEVKPSGRRALSEAMECADALNRLFNSMLDLSRLDAGVVAIEEENFDLGELLKNLHNQLKPSASGHGIFLRLEGREEAFAKTDPILLSRIIRNLVENAIAHSGATNVTIEFRRVRDQFEISVQDNGKGIDKKEHKAVFSEYYQIGNPERDRSKGLGLGLSIVKRLSQLLDIDLKLRSSPGTGTRFSMTVPIGEAEAVQSIIIPSQPMKAENRNYGAVIVVVDDDRSIRKAMGMTLDYLNYQSVCAECTDEALELLAERQLEPDLIIADYRLRDHLTGDKVIQELRAAIDRDIPGLIVTGDTSPQRVAELASTGIEILHKPVESDMLNAQIKEMLAANEAA